MFPYTTRVVWGNIFYSGRQNKLFMKLGGWLTLSVVNYLLRFSIFCFRALQDTYAQERRARMANEEQKRGVLVAQYLKDAIQTRKAKVCVIGIGYVGLPLAVEKAKVGFKVLGIDQNISRVSMLNHGQNYIQDVQDEELHSLVKRDELTAANDFSGLPEQDIIIICVPTPLNVYREPACEFRAVIEKNC